MKESYQRAVATMGELLKLEIERARMQAPVQYEDLVTNYGESVISRAGSIHDTYLV